MITTTSTRRARHLTAHLLLGAALASSLGIGLAAAPAAHAATMPGRLPLTVSGVHSDPNCPSCGGPGDPVPWRQRLGATSARVHPDPSGGCSGGCPGAGRTALTRRLFGATGAGMHPDPTCPGGGCSHMGGPALARHQLGTTSARVHPDPSAGPWSAHPDLHSSSWRAHRAPADHPGQVHPDPNGQPWGPRLDPVNHYRIACDIRACDPAAVRLSLPVRAVAPRLFLTQAHHGARPLLNPQPLPPHGDDGLRPA